MGEPHGDDRRRTDPLTNGLDFLVRRGRARREKVIAEIQANRRGEYTVPTWVLVLALVAMVGGICALLLFT
jgi:hypothetical protein